MKYVHVSDVLSYKQCRRAWSWSSPLQHNLEPARVYAPFYVGQAIHYCLENYYKSGIPWRDSLVPFVQTRAPSMMIDEEEEAIAESYLLIERMLEHYFLWANSYLGEYNDTVLEFLPEYVEYEFKVPLRNLAGAVSNRYGLSGRVDGVVRHRRTGELWLFESKTCRSLGEKIKLLPFDEQSSAYLIAAQDWLDEPVVGIIYNLMRKKAPTKPRMLDSGRPSAAVNIDTTVEAFTADIMKVYPDFSPSDLTQYYGNVIRTLAGQPNKYFWRVALRRTPNELAAAATNLWEVAREMCDQTTTIIPHGGFHCSFCRFKQPCAERNAGEDWQTTLEVEYSSRQGYYGDPIDLDLDS